MRLRAPALILCSSLVFACSDDGQTEGSSSATATETAGDGDGDSGDQESSDSVDTGDGDGDGDSGDGDGDGDTMGDGDGDSGDGDGDGDGDTMGDGDGDGEGCQPDPEQCELGTECDVISGDCLDPDLPCTLSGPFTACGDVQCGPGSVCDDQGACIPVSPCSAVTCEGDACWGDACICDRPMPCETATVDDLNGPFSTDIFDLEFADDCTAWMVTLRSGTDFVRRMTPDATMTEWAGVANLNMGEVKVLKALNPQGPTAPIADDVQAPNGDGSGDGAGPAIPVGGDVLGEVAITYTCCPTCGCFVDPPQGVARLVEGDMVPLPIVLPGVPTQGFDGPFGNTAADAGPMGLTWGEDLRLYVGNSEANGNFDTANLEAMSQDFLTMFGSRVTAAAPLTSVHLLVALDTGEILRFNTVTLEATSVVDLDMGVTTLSHDSFTGEVYASLSDLSIVVIEPFSGEVSDFDVMPNIGRVAVSPDGKLWWVPAKHVIGNLPMSTWDLPTGF